MKLFKALSILGVCLLASSVNSTSLVQDEPPAPGLVFLYTLYADCAQGIQVGNAPKGARTIFPILGGNFTGPRLSGVYNL